MVEKSKMIFLMMALGFIVSEAKDFVRGVFDAQKIIREEGGCIQINGSSKKFDISNIDLGKREEGLNVISLGLKSNSERTEYIVLDVRSTHGKLYPAWQRQFFYTLRPDEVRTVSESYEIFDINQESYLRIRLYNPQKDESIAETNLLYEQKYFYEGAKKYREPLINVYDASAVALWDEKPNPHLNQNIRKKRIQIEALDLGERKWGVNKYMLSVRNLTPNRLALKLHIWTFYETARGAIYLKTKFELKPKEISILDGWYLISLDHGKLKVAVTIIDEKDKVLARKTIDDFTSIPNEREGKILSVFNKTYAFFRHRESKHFVVYFMHPSEAEKYIGDLVKLRENVVAKIMSVLQVQLRGKIIIFFYPTEMTKLSLIFHSGLGLAYKNTIAEVFMASQNLDPYHELTHAVARQIGSPPALLSEGLAVFMQMGSRYEGKDIDAICAENLTKGRLIPLEVLFNYTEIGSQESQFDISYPEAASFVKYIVQKYGIDKFKKIYSRMKSPTDSFQQVTNLKTFDNVCKRSLAWLEEDWKSYLRQIIR